MSRHSFLKAWWILVVLFSASTLANSPANSPQQQNQKALGLMRLDHFQQAATLLQQQPESATQQALLGTAYNRLGEHQQAINALQRATELGYPSDAIAIELGWAQLQVNEFVQSRETLSTSSARVTDDPFSKELIARADDLERGGPATIITRVSRGSSG